MRLGPTLLAFLSPDVLKILAEKFDLKPMTTPWQGAPRETDINVR